MEFLLLNLSEEDEEEIGTVSKVINIRGRQTVGPTYSCRDARMQ